MKIYSIKGNIGNIQWLLPVDKNDTKKFTYYDCFPKTSWGKATFYNSNPKITPSNFFHINSGALVFDEYTLEICRTVFEMAGEILPLKVERGENLYLLNVLECLNGLNYDTTVWDYYDDGTKGRILKFGFHPERVLNEASIFKIPEVINTTIFCYADVKDPEDEFYYIYHKNKLTGLVFEEVYNSENY